jgi:acetolactate synthase-1/2/3 large subunit
MKLSNYIAQFLAEKGITHVFGMSGGAAVHMFDSIDRRSDIEIVSMTHEQCAAFAADGYARASGNMGVAISTSGPGATNLLTGTCCSYYDSIPTLMLTGQVSTHRLKGSIPVRQLGFQETDVISIFESVTKYAVQLKKAEDIRLLLEEAFYFAFEGRPGPVLIDIPDDLQRAEINPETLTSFVAPIRHEENKYLKQQIDNLLLKISESSRPVIILGGGLKTPNVGVDLIECIENLGIPTLVTWAGLELLPFNNSLRVGTFGVYGSRAGNMTIQNADLVIALGTRLSQNLTGGILPAFARCAKIIMVDIDEYEIDKFEGKGIIIDLKIKTKLKEFIKELNNKSRKFKSPNIEKWKRKIKHWKLLFPKELPQLPSPEIPSIDANDFIKTLSNYMAGNELIFCDTGGNLTWTCNSLETKLGQGVYSAWNHTPMGYSLPASVGASIFNSKRKVTCIIGDGGLMICVAELATIVHNNLPIKIFLINNHGHGIQKQTLETWLDGRMVGVNSSSGVAFPKSWLMVAESFGLKTYTISNMETINDELLKIYQETGPVFVNIEVNPEQKLYPFLKYGNPLESQSPKLKEIDISSELIIKSYESYDQNYDSNKNKSQGW